MGNGTGAADGELTSLTDYVMLPNKTIAINMLAAQYFVNNRLMYELQW